MNQLKMGVFFSLAISTSFLGQYANVGLSMNPIFVNERFREDVSNSCAAQQEESESRTEQSQPSSVRFGALF